MAGSIQYVTRGQIDNKKWDACIERSVNCLLYGYSFYLDAMAKNWDALVLNDYEAVMPLTWKRKWSIKYLYQPPLTPQLGIFSASAVSTGLVENFLSGIEKRFRFAEIFLNYGNYHGLFKSCSNYVLPLNQPYELISARYTNNLIRNLQKARHFKLHYSKEFDLQKAVLLHQQQYSERTPHVVQQDYIHFEKLCARMTSKGETICRAVFDNKNNLLAVTAILSKHNRLYLIAPTTLASGRDMQANHFLMDSIIKEFAGKNMLFDMVGSDIPGIALFYRHFGSVDQPFFFYRYNKLPWPLNLLKQRF